MDDNQELSASYPMKAVLLGQSSVGKSSLVLRFVQDRFVDHTEGTIGAAFLTKNMTLNDGNVVRLEIWDTAGQERYASLAPMYYRGAQAAIIVFDISSRDSFEKGQFWVDELREKSEPEQMVAFVANKSDLDSIRQVEKEESRKYANDNGLLYFETSAKDGTNVQTLFETLAEKLPKDSRRARSRLHLSDRNGSSDCKC